MLKKLQSALEEEPKKIFVFDGMGAVFTAVSLGIILVQLESIFGIPKRALYVLSLIPLSYLLYDIACYFLLKKKIGAWIKGIAILNFLYCPLSISFALSEREHIKLLGWIYIVIEISVILIIVFYEWRFADKLMSKDE